MKSIITVLGLLLALLPAQVQPQGAELQLSDQDRGEIRSVIESQLDAFQRDDGLTAFSFATPSIRHQFQTPDNFMTMVRKAYPPVYRPRSVQFQEIVAFKGDPAQKVLLVGQDGEPVIAVYPMQKLSDGRWGINGCFLVPVPGQRT